MKNDARVAILLPPVKSIARILVKVHEYSLDETSKWPHSLSVGDVLRATIVCSDGDTVLEAWSLISSPTGFDVRPGNGRLKNLIATTLPRPPCMLINVIVDSDDGHRPVLAEVQIELRSIIELATAQHKVRAVRHILSRIPLLLVVLEFCADALLFLCDSTTKFAAQKQWSRSAVPAMAMATRLPRRSSQRSKPIRPAAIVQRFTLQTSTSRCPPLRS